MRVCAPTLGVVRVCVSRGLARESLGFVDLFQSDDVVFYIGCYSPFPEVEVVFGFFEVF